ncbi:MAG: sugar-binding protein, partial [Eubacteriales bacterium]|nr:sugar-binding protein [Eubacteriales bacterium]
TKVERDGKMGIIRSNTDAYILFDVDDDYWYSDEPANVAVTVEYFDEVNGFFTLRYTSENGGAPFNPVEYGKNDIEWDFVRLSDTKQWKTHTFYMDDCLINGTGISGTDMAITLTSVSNGTSTESVIFHSFRIDEIYMPVPNLSIDSGHAGHIFGRNDKPELDIVAQNRTDESFKTAVSYTVKDSIGNVVKSGEYEAEIEPYSQHKQKIDTGMVEYGVYYLDVTTISTAEINGQQREFENTETFYLSKILSTEEGESKNKKIGVDAHFDRYKDMNSAFDQVVQAGFSGTRGEMYWSSIESTKGVFNLPESYKKIRAGFQRENLGYMCLLAYSNPNYITSSAYTMTTLPYTDDEIAAYADYCAYMVRELKGVTNVFEVWNEPNITAFNTQNRSGTDYARVLKAAYQAIKKENPDAIVYGCSTAGADTAFISDVLKAGGGQYLDGITIHTYDRTGVFRQDQLFEKFESVHELMKEYGIENKPIALSEMGWSCTMTTSNGGKGDITQQKQAAYTVQLIAITNRLDYLDSIYLYVLKTANLTKGSIEPGFGLTRSDKTDNPNAARPAYVAAAAINRFLAGDSEFVSAVENDKGDAAYRFKTENGEDFAVAWSSEDAGEMSLYLGCDSVDVYDMYGNKKETLYGNNGNFTFALSLEPIYLKGKFNGFSEGVPSISQKSTYIQAAPKEQMVFEIKSEIYKDCDVVVYDGENAKIINDVKMVDGRAEIKIEKTENATGEIPCDIYLYKNGRCVYFSKNLITIGEPLKIDIETRQFEEGNDKRWQAVIKLENQTNATLLSGKCKVVKPDDLAESSPVVEFKDIKPKTTRSIAINLPEMIRKRTRSIKVEIELDNGYRTEYGLTVDFTSAAYAYTKPIIDGVIGENEWSGMTLCADLAENIGLADNQRNEWDGPADLSLSGVKIMWDEKDLYISAIVCDDVHIPDNKEPNYMWKGDGLQFGLTDKNYAMAGSELATYTEISVSYSYGKPTIYRQKSELDLPTGIIETGEVAIVRNEKEKKTVYEIRIPWDEIFRENYVLTEADTFGFSMLANDNDTGTRYGWIEYNGGIGKTKDPNKFGTMTLKK